MTDSPSPLTNGGPAYLPPVAPLPLRRGLSRQVHQPKCHSAYLCVYVCVYAYQGRAVCPVVRFFPLFLFLFSLSLFLFFSSFPRWLSLLPSFFPPIYPPTCMSPSLSLSLSPYCLFLSAYPLRHHFTQQCRVVVSCHPAVRQRSSRTESKDRPGREYTLRLSGPVDPRSTVG